MGLLFVLTVIVACGTRISMYGHNVEILSAKQFLRLMSCKFQIQISWVRCSIGFEFVFLWKYHNDHDGVSNHQPHGCLLNRLFRRRSKKTSKLRVTGLCVGNSPGPVNSPHKGPVTRKMFPFDDVIINSRPQRISELFVNYVHYKDMAANQNVVWPVKFDISFPSF